MMPSEQELCLTACDESESPRVDDLHFHGCLLPLPALTNYVVVAAPGKTVRELPLAKIASRPGFDINNRRFAAVKISLGTPARSVGAVTRESGAMCENALAQVLSSPREAAGGEPAKEQEHVALQSTCEAVRAAADGGALRHPMATCLFFASGNMVCTGSSNAYAAMHTVHMTAHRIRQVVSHYPTPVCKVENIVASVKLYDDIKEDGTHGSRKKRRRKQTHTSGDSEGLHLAPITKEFGLRATYRPGLFPGAIFRPQRRDGGPVVCFLVFPSGQCVITGAKQTQDVFTQFRRFFIAFTWVVLRKQQASFVRGPVKQAIKRANLHTWEDAMEL